MSASNEWTLWHLTPRGWERGTEKTDFGAANEKPAPSDRVLTFKYREFMSSMYSPIEKTRDEVWRSQDECLITDLLAKFGSSPRSL